ncbi:hypothetical protein BLX87_02680 [Bacillus sp. VT-16-64]|nr:hypothetical protein BLX87_02680 [Bacillus sp. VT-16-64]
MAGSEWGRMVIGRVLPVWSVADPSRRPYGPVEHVCASGALPRAGVAVALPWSHQFLQSSVGKAV